MKEPTWHRDAALALGTAVFGVVIGLRYGRIGFMPLDQSIVFDGGWRVLSGQVPFRDFTTPSGITPILLQALFFKWLGVNWFAYCLHAAVANGLFCAIVYGILRMLGGGRRLPFGYGVLSGVVFYPPFGVPYVDQHAFFFGAAAVLLAVAATRVRGSWGRTLGLAGLPVALLFAYLSKQIPAIFFLPLLAVPPWLLPGQRRRTVLVLAGSSVTAIAAAVLAAGLLGVELRLFLESFVFLPGAAGEARLRSLSAPGALLVALVTVPWSWGLLSTGLVHLAALGLGIHLVRRDTSPAKTSSVLRLLLAEHLLLTCTLFAMLTKNEPENSIPYGFLALGLVQVSVASSLSRWPRFAAAIATALAITATVDAYRFNARVNKTRLVLGLEDTPQPAEAPTLPPGLSFMSWRDPSFGGYTAQDLSALLRFLRDHPGNFLLVGDASILYGLSGRPSVNPVLWFHPRLTLPGRSTPGFVDYERRLIESLRRYQVRYVVVEMNGTFMGSRPAAFPSLVDYIQARIKGRRSFGSFDVIDLGVDQPSAGGPWPKHEEHPGPGVGRALAQGRVGIAQPRNQAEEQVGTHRQHAGEGLRRRPRRVVVKTGQILVCDPESVGQVGAVVGELDRSHALPLHPGCQPRKVLSPVEVGIQQNPMPAPRPARQQVEVGEVASGER